MMCKRGKHMIALAGSKIHCKMLAAGGTEHLLLAIKFIECIGFEHDTFPVLAMIEAKEMPDLMSPLLGNPVHKIIIVVLSPVIFIAEPGCGDNCRTHLLAGEAEDKTVAVPEEILMDNKKDGFCDPVAVLIGLDAVKKCLGIDLFPADHISHHPDVVLGNRSRHAEDRRNHA
jgi:hypothetical protein